MDATCSAVDANRRFYDALWSASSLVPPQRFNTWPLLSWLAASAPARLEIGPGIVPQVQPRTNPSAHEIADWTRTNVRAQKQAGWSMVTVATVLGDLTSAQMRLIGDLANGYGDGTVRVTADQNLVFRWVASRDVERCREIFDLDWRSGLDPDQLAAADAASRIVIDPDAAETTCPACLTKFATGPMTCPECGLTIG